MFRIEYLKLTNHPQLGDFEIWLSETNEYTNRIEKPYTSVIIGPNGTGKSYILRTIAEIFRQFKAYRDSEKKDFSLPFGLHLRYKYYHNTYEIITRRLKVLDKKSRKEYIFYKNRPVQKDLISEIIEPERITGYEILPEELEFPDKLLVNSVMFNDRFVWQNSNPSDFYQYLGARSTKSTASTKSSSRKTIKYLLGAIEQKKYFIQNLKDLLNFLEFEENFKVQYLTRVNKLFFSGKLTLGNFKKYFEEWWVEDFPYSRRKKENPSWSIPFYNKYFKNNKENSIQLVDFLNDLSNRPDRLEHKANSPAKILSIDIFNKSLTSRDLEMIGHLEKLDIINLEGIKIRKSNSTLSINDISSGEYHLLISLIGIFSNISDNSLVLIDEPEISLHPNWQMQYISFLKKVFAKYSGTHFILTTHSHFLVSDLEGESSAVIALTRDDESNMLFSELLKGQDTFGWSAEDVLYRVFNVKTTSNYYLEMDLRIALSLIKNNSKDKKELDMVIDRLKKLSLNKADPTNEIIKQIIEYNSQL